MQRKVFGACLGIFLAITASAQKININYDRTADFSKFKTYSWGKNEPATNPLIDQQIITLIDQQIGSKGLRRVAEKGDLIVSYHAFVGNNMAQSTAVRGAPGGGNDQLWGAVRGALIVVMKGPNDQDVWRGTAPDTLSNDPGKDPGSDVDKATKKISKVLDKMFKKFPPQ